MLPTKQLDLGDQLPESSVSQIFYDLAVHRQATAAEALELVLKDVNTEIAKSGFAC